MYKKTIYPIILAQLLTAIPCPAQAEIPQEEAWEKLHTETPQISWKAPNPSVGGGTTFTGGSGGYHKIALYSDAEWREPVVDPYGWAQFDSDNYVGEFSFGGGVWKDLARDLRVKGGLGIILGHIHNTDKAENAFTLETGAEKDFGLPTVGTEYRLTRGSIGGPSDINGNDQNLQGRFNAARGKTPGAEPQPYTYNELSAYAGMPVENTRLKLRLTLGLPSYDSSIVSEMLSWQFPISNPLSANTALTFEEQHHLLSVYFSLGIYYRFQ